MELNISKLEKFCAKYLAVNFSVDLVNDRALLIAIMGTAEQNGNRREYFEFADLMAILTINKIIGKGSIAEKEMEREKQSILSAKVLDDDDSISIEELIYDLLARYIAQLLLSSLESKIYYPEILLLEEHKSYFKTTA